MQPSNQNTSIIQILSESKLETGIQQTKLFFLTFLFHYHSRMTVMQGKRDGISLTPHRHFHPLHRYLYIRRVIVAGSSPVRIGKSWEPLISGRKSLTTKLSP